ncbi:MAG: SMC-Scp complex subunit ScpB [Gammaproteobacteria bacterium]|nr:SMC-Scp complex subunit ScpB [Gammaproteobacteria bacterium]
MLQQLKRIIEAALMAVGRPLSLQHIAELFDAEERPSTGDIQDALNAIGQDCEGRGFELKVVASGYRLQVCEDLAPWVGRLWEEKPQRYSRAMLETLALIAYRQPITRGDIEDIRGVAVSSQIIKTMLEREWVRVVGHKDVPGRPAMYATTRKFLDYFNLRNLDELPSLAEITDLDTLNGELELHTGEFAADASTSDIDQAAADTDTDVEAEADIDVETEVNGGDVYDQEYPPETNF